MKINVIAIASAAILFSCSSEVPKEETITYNYPDSRQDTTVVDDYFGTAITDPYRWLENDTSAETGEWVAAQNALTNDYLAKIPFRGKLKEQLTSLWDYETIGTPSKYGEYYIYTKNDGKQNQSVYYIKVGEDGNEEILLDPNTMSDDGTTSVGGLSVSKDHKYLGYTFSESGSDWKEIVVMNLETKEMLTDKILWSKFSGINWFKDGFFYSGYEAPKKGKEFSNKNEYHKLFYHKIGTDQTEDKIIFEDKEHPLRNHYASVTEDCHFLSVQGVEGTSGNSLHVKDLSKSSSDFVTFIADFDNDSYVIDNNGETLLIFTDYKAPNKRVVKTTINTPEKDSWTDFIPTKDYVLENVSIVGDKMFAKYLKDVQSKIEILDMEGSYIKDLELPGIGICSGISGDKGENTGYYSFTSFTTPRSSYKINTDDLTSELYFKPTINFNPDNYVTEQVRFKSKDGESIPMFVTHKKGLKMDGSNPTLLYGYGGFQISIKPYFSVTNAVFMQNGGIYAVVTLRGGNEFGEAWHKAGMLNNKQNVFNDFIAAGNYLKDNKYTSTEKLAIHGRSNGGLLVGAVMTQEPDLAAVALPGVGVLDMLRYHKFTIGWAWATEYGSSDKEADFKNLMTYSPLHNVKPVDYPATMIMTADHDDRVVPAHSFKFAAELQKQNTGTNSMLIRIEAKAGHGAGKPKNKLIDEWADVWAFTFFNLGVNIK
ncbi:MAG: S9 family peptidase [Flavobacteriales bacterium]|nr:MAG: S9 family peptidase [Flavobacteriales bacterium]